VVSAGDVAELGSQVGALQVDGHVTRRDGAPGSSSGGRQGLAVWFLGSGDRGGERCAVLQPLEEQHWAAAPASP